MRVYGDLRCNPEFDCGRRMYSRTKRLAKHLKKAATIAGIVHGVSYFGALAMNGIVSVGLSVVSTLSGIASVGAWSLYGGMKMVDKTFNGLVAPTRPRPRHDGLVPVSSQRCARAVEEFVIEKVDSHRGSPASPLVRDQLRDATREALLTPRP
jgi:hypothetical protein